MAKNIRVNIQAGFSSIDKSGFNEIQTMLDKITVKASQPGKELDTKLQQAGKTASRLSDILDKSFNRDLGTLNIAKFNQELSKTHLDMAMIKKDFEGIELGSRAFNQLSSSILSANVQIKKSNEMLDRMATTFKNTIRYGISSSIFNNFANSFQKAFDYSKNLDKSLNDIRIVTKASVEQMDEFAVKANEASKKLGTSTLDYTNAALIYYQQGLDPEEVKARAEVTLKAANVTGQSGKEVSELLTSVWNGYKVTAEESELYVDKLAAVAAATASNLEELSTGMSKVASAANLMGVDVDQLNAQLATIISVTRQAPESVGTALKTIYARMGDIEAGLDTETTLGNYTEQMAQMGVNVLDANGKLRNMGEVIEEIGNKWGDLSREQQIALSQTMAGARQYNNLLALFDNWEKYEDSIDKSRNAVGTLQKQQDIYMQSTAAKLEKLKATWEDLYDSAIDTKEINTGINLLTNLVQTFDNFIDSFGGGLKTLGAFGAVFANIMNKQISESITNFLNNQSIMEQNLALLEQKKSVINAGSLNSTVDRGEQANVDKQIEYARQILEIQSGITQEQYIQLTNLQTQQGELEKQAVILEDSIVKSYKEAAGSEERFIEIQYQKNQGAEAFQKYLELELASSQRELSTRKDIESRVKRVLIDEEKELDIKEDILYLENNVLKGLGLQLKYKDKILKGDKLTVEQRQETLDILNKIVQAEEKEVQTAKKVIDAADEELKTREKINEIKRQQDSIDVEFNATKKIGEKATSITKTVTTVTSALSSMAMSWASINSLYQTWTDKNATLGDKITQTIITAGMTIPSLISSMSKLNEVMGYTTSISGILQAKETLRNLTTIQSNAQQEIENQLIEKYCKLKGIQATEISTTMKSRISELAATKAQTVAIEKETIAQEALNKSMLANPLMWIVAGAAAIIGAISAITSEIKRQNEAIMQNNSATIESANQKQEELKTNEALYKSYNDLYSAYEKGEATKEQLNDATDKLIGLLKEEDIEATKLNGTYGKLNEQILNLRKQQAQQGITSAEREANAAAGNVTLKARQGKGYLDTSTGRYNFGLNAGLARNDEKELENILKNSNISGLDIKYLENGVLNIEIGYDADSITKLYDQLMDVRTEAEKLDPATYQVSEYYKQIKEWTDRMKDDIEIYKKAMEDIVKYKTQLEAFSIVGITDFDEFENQREKIKDFLSQQEEYKNLTEEQLYTITDNYIKELDDSAAEMLNKIMKINILVDKFGEENREQITNALKDLSSENISFIASVNEEESLGNFDDFLKKAQEEAKKYHITANIKEDLKGLNVSEDVFEEYVETLKEVRKTAGETGVEFDNLNERTENVALYIAQVNQALKDLSKNFEENKKLIEEHNTSSLEYVKALAEMKTAMSTIIGTDVSENFIRQNLNDIQALVDGDLEAIDRLRKAAAQDILLKFNIDFNNDELQNDFNVIQDWVNNLNAQEIVIDSSLNDGPFVDALNHLLASSAITKEQASKLLNSIGYNPKIEYETVYWPTGEYYEDEKMKASRMVMKTAKVPKIIPQETLYTGSGSSYTSPSTSSGSGGGSTKQPDTMNPLEDEKDRYHDINIILKQLENEMDKLKDQRDKLFGADLIENLNKQLNILNKQIDATNEKINIARGESQELRDILAGQGVSFNEDGTISNYAEAYTAQLNYVNSLVNQYNSMSAEAQEGFKDTVQTAQDSFDTFVRNIDRYDELLTDFIPGLETDIQEAIDQKIDIQIEKFDMEIDIRLNMADAEKQWNDFKKKVIDEISDEDILGNARARLLDFDIYYGANGNKSIQAQTRHLQEVLDEYAKQRQGLSNIYGDNQQAALDDLKKYQDQLMEDLEEVFDLEKEIHESYINMMDEAQDKFDEHIESYEVITDILEHDMNLIKMTLGEDAYGELSKYYQLQEDNYNKQIQFRSQEMAFWKEQMDILEENSNEWVAARQKWEEALKDWQSDVETAFENIREKFENEINLIFKNLNDKITGGQGLEYINEQWNLINKNSEQYLDNINAMTGIRSLEQKYLKEIEKSNSTSVQNRLNALREQEISSLEEKDKLTKYDLDRAEKRYKLELALIALEEAQQNKSQMRLRRDSQGNYSYQYVADTDAIKEAKENVNNLYQELYNFDKEAYINNLNQAYSVWDEYQQKMAEAALINDPQKRAEREMLLQEQYGDLINGLTSQNITIRENLHESAFSSLANLYEQDLEAYTNLTYAEQDLLLNDMIPQWNSGVQQMIDKFVGEGGFEEVTKQAMENISEATNQYKTDLSELENVANTSFDAVQNGIDVNIQLSEQLVKENQEVINSYDEQLKKVRAVIEEVEKLAKTYSNTKNEALGAIEAANRLRAQTMEEAASASQANNANSNVNSSSSSIPVTSSSQNVTAASVTGEGDGVLSTGDLATYIGGTYFSDSYGGGPTGNRGPGKKVRVTMILDDGRPYPIHVVSDDSAYGWLRKDQLRGYDTGGYTGAWDGGSGRLALLHQKELVLNATDTKNMLDAVSILRNITSSLGDTILNRLAGISAQNVAEIDNYRNGIQQNVHIDASFPNATNHFEIETALMNLTNAAYQKIQEKNG